MKTVIFLNPEVLEKQYQIIVPGDTDMRATGGVTGSVSLRDEASEALGELCTAADAVLVCTKNPAGGIDAREFIRGRGISATFGPEWFSYDAATDRRGQIDAWLARHGSPPCITIDRHGAGSDHAIRITIAAGHGLDRSLCNRALAMLQENRSLVKAGSAAK